MYREVTAFRKNEPIQTGLGFANNTRRAPAGIATMGVISALTAWHAARSAERASTDGVGPAASQRDRPQA